MAFVGGSSPNDAASQVTPESLAIRRKLALALMQEGSSAAPVRSWTQGLARIAQGISGGYDLYRSDQQEQSARQDATKQVLAALSPQSAAAPAAASPAVDSSAPRGYRNNNPLNIEAGDFSQSQPGYSGSDGRFAQFNSMDQGTGAADKLLQVYGGKGINTVGGIVNRWAPPTDNNPTDAYAATVAKSVGVDPNAPIDLKDPSMRQKIIAAMAQFENGKPMPAAAQPTQVAQAAPQAAQQAPAAAPAAAPGAAPAQSGVDPRLVAALSNQFLPPGVAQIAAARAQQQMAPPEFKQTGQTVLGQPQYGWVNPQNQTVTPIGGGQGGGQNGAATNGTDPSFQKIAELQAKGAAPADLYQQVPQELRSGVQAVIEGRSLPSNLGMRAPARSAIMLYAHAIDPSFDETVIPQRETFARSMGQVTPTSVGGQKTLLGTSLGHLSDAADRAVALGNVNGLGSADLAHATNWVRGRTTDQSAKVNALEDAAQKFSGEVGKLYSGSSGGGIHEREETRSRINGNKAPEELASGLEINRDLILSKLQALEQQRDDAYGKMGSNIIDFQTPQVKQALANIQAKIDQLRGGQQPAAGSGAAAPAAQGVDPAALAEAKKRGLIP